MVEKTQALGHQQRSDYGETSMSNAHRLDAAHSDFFADVRQLIESPAERNHMLVRAICQKYGITQETLYWRIRSFYGKGIGELRREFFTPSREALLYAVKRCATTDEVRRMLNIPSTCWTGIYERVLGVATFQQARQLTVEAARLKAYNPSTRDNVALIAATRLGAGTYDHRRGELRIKHGPAQSEWLRTKVALFRRALPTVKTDIVVTARGIYCWQSGRINGFEPVLTAPKETLPELLTPIGVWLLFLDTGTYICDHEQQIAFAVKHDAVAMALITHLQTYGFDFTIRDQRIVIVGGQIAVKQFLNTFGMPFYNLTPESMRYKIVFRSL